MASRRYELGVGCLLLAAAGVLAFMAVQVGVITRLGRSTVDVSARFHDAAGVQVGAAVSVAGVEVGEVRGMRIEHDLAIVDLALDPSALIGKDARVRVRMRSLLGEKYIELVPGVRGFPAATDGDVLVVASEQLELDELVATLGPLLQGIDTDAAGRVIKALADALEKDPERLSRMLDNADLALANGALASKDLPTLVTEGRATLAQTRTTLADVTARSRQGGEVLGKADRALDDLSAATADLPELTDRAGAVLDDSHALIGSLDERSDQLDVILANFSEFDRWEIRRLLREEGVLVRIRPAEVDPLADPGYDPRGQVKP